MLFFFSWSHCIYHGWNLQPVIQTVSLSDCWLHQLDGAVCAWDDFSIDCCKWLWLDPSLQANLLPKADRELNNSNKLQRHASLELCPNTRPAQGYPRDAAVGLRSDMASGNSWFHTCPGLCIEQTFEFSLLRHRPAPKGKEIEMRFLLSFPSLSFACRITLVPSASLSFWESLFYQQFSSTCTFLRPRESQSWK